MAGPHDKLLAAAAKQALGPYGYKRKGQSRTWLADNRWWLGVVEFQPSAWDKGSYLNVAAHLLWSDSGHLSFDYGGRVAEFRAFNDEQQFSEDAAELAAQACVESQLITQSFASLADAGNALAQAEAEQWARQQVGWMAYHAGVAMGLLGRVDQADTLFRKIVDDPAVSGSVLDQSTTELLTIAHRQTELREEMRARVGRQRQALKLAPANDLPF